MAPRVQSIKEQEEIRKQIESLLNAGIIRKSKASYYSQFTLTLTLTLTDFALIIAVLTMQQNQEVGLYPTYDNFSHG